MKMWQKKNFISYSLYPFSMLFRAAAFARKRLYEFEIFESKKFRVPIIVVGNIALGGTGKTPLVIYLAKLLKSQGFNPGIVSRGYRSNAKEYPFLVSVSSSPVLSGDEPLLIARQTQCPVVIDPKRTRAAEYLLEHYPIDIIITDDGLQHYALKRDIEIAVINQYHNGFCLPSGPLREPVKRLKSVDMIVNTDGRQCSNDEFNMIIKPTCFTPISHQHLQLPPTYFAGKTCHAVAAIGNPERFFNLLKLLDINIIPHAFPDHHTFQKEELYFDDNKPILMTEKDAVKCESFNLDQCWSLRIESILDEQFDKEFLMLLNRKINLD